MKLQPHPLVRLRENEMKHVMNTYCILFLEKITGENKLSMKNSICLAVSKLLTNFLKRKNVEYESFDDIIICLAVFNGISTSCLNASRFCLERFSIICLRFNKDSMVEYIFIEESAVKSIKRSINSISPYMNYECYQLIVVVIHEDDFQDLAKDSNLKHSSIDDCFKRSRNASQRFGISVNDPELAALTSIRNICTKSVPVIAIELRNFGLHHVHNDNHLEDHVHRHVINQLNDIYWHLDSVSRVCVDNNSISQSLQFLPSSTS
ncbi:hypothetical protein DERP_006141 [Dermatophagoides pteronyssinus]|uniref:Uncharacterized protein n=1 Tax=Dermatophagoides pteronyssinus TaxID=6956 RepID=A0ABQ8JTF3_DERPT|nr:hypothetical protein DERP_006141 [Dermatophagoides pteronyssinus]